MPTRTGGTRLWGPANRGGGVRVSRLARRSRSGQRARPFAGFGPWSPSPGTSPRVATSICGAWARLPVASSDEADGADPARLDSRTPAQCRTRSRGSSPCFVPWHPAPLPARPARAARPDRRRTSARTVLRSVLEHGPVARSTVARLTGLSPASVTGHCARLAELGLLREASAPRRSGGVGRPHLPLVDRSRLVVGGVHVAVPYTTAALLDLRGRVVAERRPPHPDTEPARVLERPAGGLAELLGRVPQRRPLGVGFAAGGWVDRAAARSSTIRCRAGGTSRRARCCAPVPGCRSMWTGTHGRWRTRSGCSGGRRGAAGARRTCSPGTSSTRPSPPMTRCTTGPGPRRARSPICRWRAAPSRARAAGPAASRPS